MQADIKAGSSVPKLEIKLVDAVTGEPRTDILWNTAGLALWGQRTGGNVVAFSPAEMDSPSSAWASGGFVHVKDGIYQVCPPVSLVAAISGSSILTVGATLSGVRCIEGQAQIVAYDPLEAKLGMANGGLGDITRNMDIGALTGAPGSGQSTIFQELMDIVNDIVAVNSALSSLRGTLLHYEGPVSQEVEAVFSPTEIDLTGIAGLPSPGAWIGCSIHISTGTGAGQTCVIKNWDGSVLTVFTPFATVPDSSSEIVIYSSTSIPPAVFLQELPTYFLDFNFTRDQENTTDEYLIGWFKDYYPLFNGISDVKLWVCSRTGTNLIGTKLAPVDMTEIGDTQLFKYDATGAARVGKGEAATAVITATIDGATRTWRKNFGRDN